MSAEHSLTTLPGGVRVVTERVPAVRSVAVGFWIATGSAGESDAEAGLSHLLEHMLFRGTDRFRSVEIDQIFDTMGAELNAGTDKESTSVYSRVMDRHLERAFEVMAGMVWRPAFEDIEAEREVVLEEIAMYEDDPQDRVFDLFGEALFGGHPLGRAIVGDAAVVGSAERNTLHAFHAARYVPRSVVVAAAGAVEHEEIVALTERAGWAREGSPPREPDRTVPALQPRVRFLRRDTEQYHVCLGAPGIARDDDRRFTLRVLDGILGGTSSSRLFQEVRERRGLAYSVYSFSDQFADAGEVGVYLGTRPENLDEALRIVGRELERFLERPPSAEELDRSREHLKGRMVLALESTGARMNRLGHSVLGELPILSTEEVIERIDAVSADDVLALARELLAPERLSVAGVGTEEEAFSRALHGLAGLSEATPA